MELIDVIVAWFSDRNCWVWYCWGRVRNWRYFLDCEKSPELAAL